MRSAGRVLLLIVATVAAASAPAGEGGAESVTIGDSEQYGRYRVVAVPEGVEVLSPSPARTGWVLVGIGLVMLGVAAAVQLRGGPRVAVFVSLAAACAAMAGLALLDRSRLRVTDVSVAHEGFGGRTREWRRDEISHVELTWRHATGPEVKRQIHRVWSVSLRGGHPETRLVAYRFEQESGAFRFAERLAGLLEVPLSDGGGG